jgi:hypothetical protein
MRDYARVHDLVLFDVADILSHDPAGNPCYDNRDGVAYLDEDHPDDNLDIPAICPQYTTETEGGHLGSISAGGIRVAKAFWVLMARIAGWDGGTSDVENEGESAASRLPAITIAPNPARDYFSATFVLSRSGYVRMDIIDVLGKTMGTINAGERTVGSHTTTFAWPRNLSRARMYFLRLITPQGVGAARIFIE